MERERERKRERELTKTEVCSKTQPEPEWTLKRTLLSRGSKKKIRSAKYGLPRVKHAVAEGKHFRFHSII